MTVSQEITPELVGRMVALVQLIKDQDATNRSDPWIVEYEPGPIFIEALTIAALLPEPVDPDWAEAEALAFNAGFWRSTHGRAIADDFLRAIKRGRELERGQ